MTPDHLPGLEFIPFTAFRWLAALAVIGYILILLSYRRPAREMPRPLRAMLLLLRGFTISLVLLLLLDPHWLERNEYREPTELAVLLDASASMTLQDSPTEPPRADWVRSHLTRELLPALADEYRVRLYTFGESVAPLASLDAYRPDQTATHMASALKAVLGQGRTTRLGGVVLLSDGQDDEPELALAAADLLRQSGVPIFSHPVGTPDEAPDIRLESVRGEQIVPFEPRIRIHAEIESPGYLDRETLVTIRVDDYLLYEEIVTLNGSRQHIAAECTSPFFGFQAYDVALTPLAGERLTNNNQATVGLDLLDQKIRVLYMEGTPYASHDLENGLEADPDIEVTSLYFPQMESFEAARNMPFQVDVNGRKIYNVAHPQKGFPRTLDELLYFDVVINSDIYKEAFTPQQLDNTVALVEQHGGGFVMVGGTTAFGAGNYDQTVIDKLMPVDVYGNQDFAYGSFKLTLPQKALDHPIMRVGADPDETVQAWTVAFPGFSGMNEVNRAKPGAVVLAVNDSKQNRYGNLIVFAVQQIGRGRTMAFTSDTTQAWGAAFNSRWGKAGDRTFYFRKFWNNAIRWLAADRIKRKNAELTVTLSIPSAAVGEVVHVAIPVPENSPDLPITAAVRHPDGSLRELQLTRDRVDDVHRAELHLDAPGPYVVTARLQKAADQALFAKALVTAGPDRREYASTRANLDLLQQLADRSQGRLLLDHDPSAIRDSLGSLGSRVIEYREDSAWDTLPVLTLLVGLLATEWFLRRARGLV